MLDEDLNWVVQWYYSLYIEDKLSDFNLKISTLDNPGWTIKINIQGTEEKKFEDIFFERSEHDWLACTKKEGVIEGYCGPFNFPELLLILRRWGEGSTAPYKEKKMVRNDNLNWLSNWFYSQCDGDWEHCYGIKIESCLDPGWHLTICLGETELQEKFFSNVKINRSKNDWLCCFIENNIFESTCGPFNLDEVLQIFRDWAES